MPGLSEALALDHPALLGVCLSGAGPSIAAIVKRGDAAAVVALLQGLYERLGVTSEVRAVDAHQPFRAPDVRVRRSR